MLSMLGSRGGLSTAFFPGRTLGELDVSKIRSITAIRPTIAVIEQTPIPSGRWHFTYRAEKSPRLPELSPDGVRVVGSHS